MHLRYKAFKPSSLVDTCHHFWSRVPYSEFSMRWLTQDNFPKMLCAP